MLAYAGFIAQHIVTGTTPLANLSAHLSDPWGAQSVAKRLANTTAAAAAAADAAAAASYCEKDSDSILRKNSEEAD